MGVFNGNIMENHRKIIYQWLFVKLLECSLLVQKIPSQMQGFARMVFVRSCLCICRICICRCRQDKCYTIHVFEIVGIVNVFHLYQRISTQHYRKLAPLFFFRCLPKTNILIPYFFASKNYRIYSKNTYSISI